MALFNDRFSRLKVLPCSLDATGTFSASLLRPNGPQQIHKSTTGLKGLVQAITLGAVLAVSTPALAQRASEKAAAEALFDEGVKLLKAGEFAQACQKLERSQAVDPGIGTLLYLGECYKQAGRSASAWATFREATSKADAVGEAERARAGKRHADELEPLLSRITFKLAESNLQIDDISMLQGGRRISRALWGSAIPVDPGELEIVVQAPGYEDYRSTILIEKGPAQTSINIPALVKLPDESKGDPNTGKDSNNQIFAPVEPEPKESGVSQRRAGFIIGGVGVLGLGAGGVLGALAIVNNNKANDACQSTTCSTDDGLTKSDNAQLFATASTVAFIAGGALLAGGAIIYYTAPAGHQRMGLNLTPTVGGARLNLGGTF